MAARPATARERLLGAADRLFYAEGIRNVPVDRVIAEAGVTRATFYRHFPSKDELVRSYVEARDQAIRAAAARAAEAAASPPAVLRAVVDAIADDVCAPGFRGCPFINAAAEFPDPAHPVHRAVLAHRAWFRDTLVAVLTAAGRPDAAADADVVVMLRDGAMVAGYLSSPDAVRTNLTNAVGRLIAP